MAWKTRPKFFHGVENSLKGFLSHLGAPPLFCPPPLAPSHNPAIMQSRNPPSLRRPQDVAAEDFFRIWAGPNAETTGRFSDGDASRTTRAGLPSARGRPRNVHAEKMPVGFRAAQMQKKSSPLPSHLPTHLPTPPSHPNLPPHPPITPTSHPTLPLPLAPATNTPNAANTRHPTTPTPP